MHQRPELGQVVLDRCRRQQQDRRLARLQELAHAPGRARVRRVLVVLPELVEALVYTREHFMRLVDHAQVERLAREQRLAPVLAAGLLAPDQEYPFAVETSAPRLAFSRGDIEQLEQLLLPLAE